MSGVSVDNVNGLAWIRFVRPDRRNAYDHEMAAEVAAAVDASSGEDILAVVITGSGGSFCAGGALGALRQPDQDDIRSLFRGSLRMFDAIRGCPRPVIAAVNGVAAGEGTSSSWRATWRLRPAAPRSARPARAWARRRSSGRPISWRCRSARSGPRSGRFCACATPPRKHSPSAWSTRSLTTRRWRTGSARSVRRSAAQPALPRDREAVVERMVEHPAGLLRIGHGDADPGRRQRGHGGGSDRIPRKACSAVPPARLNLYSS